VKTQVSFPDVGFLEASKRASHALLNFKDNGSKMKLRPEE
jgi:hypothetical protein